MTQANESPAGRHSAWRRGWSRSGLRGGGGGALVCVDSGVESVGDADMGTGVAVVVGDGELVSEPAVLVVVLAGVSVDDFVGYPESVVVCGPRCVVVVVCDVSVLVAEGDSMLTRLVATASAVAILSAGMGILTAEQPASMMSRKSESADTRRVAQL